MERLAGPAGGFVAEHDPGQELSPVVLTLGLGHGQGGGQDTTAGVALRRAIAVMGVEGIDGRRARQRSTRGADPPVIEQHPGATPAAGAELRRREAADDARALCPRRRRGNADQIENAAASHCSYRQWHIVVGQVVDEVSEHGQTPSSLLTVSLQSAKILVGFASLCNIFVTGARVRR